jgi:hypothetical protein
MTVDFQRVDGTLTGSGEGQFGAFPIVDIVVAGSDLTFALRFEQNGQTFDIPLNLKGKVTAARYPSPPSARIGSTREARKAGR